MSARPGNSRSLETSNMVGYICLSDEPTVWAGAGATFPITNPIEIKLKYLFTINKSNDVLFL